MASAVGWSPGFQVSNEAPKSSLIRVGPGPVAEVSNVALTTDGCGPGVGGERDGVIERDGKENLALLLPFTLKTGLNLFAHPIAFYRVFGQDQQQLVMLIDLILN